MAKHADSIDLWGEHPFPPAEPVNWKVGTLRLWSRSTEQEVWLAYQHDNDSEEEPSTIDAMPEDLVWSRWALKKPYQSLRLVPVHADRPMLVRPEQPFRVLQKTDARIYMRIPIWLKIEVGSRSRLKLLEVPTIILSDTWFGSTTAGELCYWISTGARRQIEPDLARPFLAICPVQIKNESDDELFFEKICLRVEYLALFTCNGQLWSDETRIRYHGKNEASRIENTGKVPPEAKEATMITPPRKDNKKGLAAKTFATLRELSGIELLSR